jgi:Leucine-rich repeat (LRR) protein
MQTDLTQVTTFEVRVSAEEHNLAELLTLLPRLEQLTLDGSHISSFRDLGVASDRLTHLSLAHVGIIDLDGLGDALPNLRELNLAGNPVRDVAPLAYHASLKSINLQGYAGFAHFSPRSAGLDTQDTLV